MQRVRAVESPCCLGAIFAARNMVHSIAILTKIVTTFDTRQDSIEPWQWPNRPDAGQPFATILLRISYLGIDIGQRSSVVFRSKVIVSLLVVDIPEFVLPLD